MRVVTYEGIVDGDQIRLKGDVHLPDRTKVYVVVPALEAKQVVHVYSPRLAHPEQATDFRKEIVEVAPDASL